MQRDFTVSYELVNVGNSAATALEIADNYDINRCDFDLGGGMLTMGFLRFMNLCSLNCNSRFLHFCSFEMVSNVDAEGFVSQRFDELPPSTCNILFLRYTSRC